MALTLKTSGIALNLVMCVAVDDDGVTIREFVSSDVNTNKVVDGTGVTVSSSTWKGTARGYFATSANGSFNFHGINFASGHQPTDSDLDTDGSAWFIAFANSTAASGTAIFAKASGLSIGRLSNKICLYGSGFLGIGGTTTLPTDGTTKFSVGVNHQQTAGDAYYFGFEAGAGALAADGTSAGSAGFGLAASAISTIGGWSGQGNAPGAFHIVAKFNRQLTLTEMQSLHNDWFNTLFTTGTNNPPTFPGPNIADMSGTVGVAISSVDVSGKFSDTDALTYSAQGTWPAGITVSSAGVISGTPTAAGTYATLKVRATDTVAQTVDSNTFTFTVTSGATITTPPLKNNTGTLLASQTAATATISNPTTGALVVKKTGQTTDASGIMTISDATLASGTSYRVVITLASGAEGMAVIAAV